MISRFRTRKWTPPVLPTADKIELAQKAEQLGTKVLARQMCPWDMRVLFASVGVFLLGLALLGIYNGETKFVAVIGIAFTVVGFIQLPITIFHGVQNRALCVDWLSDIQKFYGRDRAKYGN